MSKIKLFVVIALLLVAMTMGCLETFETTDEVEAKQGNEKMTYLYGENGIEVYHDNIQNVTCWKYNSLEARGDYNRLGAGGISCIPDWMLTPQNMSNNCNCE